MLVARYGVSIGEGGNRNSSLDSMWWRETWWECVEKRMRFYTIDENLTVFIIKV